MGTPADQAMAGAKGGAAPAGGGSPNGGAAPGGGSANQPFFAAWDKPEQAEIRAWAQNKNYPDTFTLARTARDLEREAATIRQGKGYPVPGQDGKEDENAVKAWRALTGVPESADKYDLAVPAENPYPQFKAYVAEELLKAHVPGAMATRISRGYEAAMQRMETELRAQEDTASTEGLKQLERDWGPQYQERMGIANAGKSFIAQEVGGLTDIQLRTLEAVLGTPKWMTLLYKFGAGNTEHRFAGDGGSPPGFQGGASEAQARLDALTAARSAGEISAHQWREITKTGGEYDQLVSQITKGFAQ